LECTPALPCDRVSTLRWQRYLRHDLVAFFGFQSADVGFDRLGHAQQGLSRSRVVDEFGEPSAPGDTRTHICDHRLVLHAPLNICPLGDVP
jgi:hypothetical protein